MADRTEGAALSKLHAALNEIEEMSNRATDGAINGVNLYQIHRFEVVGFRNLFSAFTFPGWRLSSGSSCPLRRRFPHGGAAGRGRRKSGWRRC